MKQSYFILLELVFLWSTVFASDLDKGNVNPAGEFSWMVTVTLVNGRRFSRSFLNWSFPDQSDLVMKAYDKILCAGVIVDSNLIYVPARSVKNINPDDLEVVVQSSNEKYAVKEIVRSDPYFGIRKNALLVLSDRINNYQAVSVIETSDTANASNCLASELFTYSLVNSTHQKKIPRRGTFGRFHLPICFELEVFQRPELESNGVTSMRHQHGMMSYASPLVCSSQDDSSHYMLIGFWEWVFAANTPKDFFAECYADRRNLKSFIDKNRRE